MKTLAGRNGLDEQATTFSKQANWESLLAGIGGGKVLMEIGTGQTIFLQGERANTAFYLQQGRVKRAVTSEEGKEAIVALVDAGEFFGEGCLLGQEIVRSSTATALTNCSIVRLDKSLLVTLLSKQRAFSEALARDLLLRNIRYQEDLVDQLSNTSEQRLARNLLRMAGVAQESAPSAVLPKMNHETLAQMVGTTRSRICHFMTKFKQHGFVDYNSHGDVLVHSKLLSVIGGGAALA